MLLNNEEALNLIGQYLLMIESVVDPNNMNPPFSSDVDFEGEQELG